MIGSRQTEVPQFHKISPNLSGGVAFYHLPSQQTIASAKADHNLAMVMSLQTSESDNTEKKCELIGVDFEACDWNVEKSEMAETDVIVEKMIKVLNVMKDGKNVLVYCYSGAHRSATFGFLLARAAGLCPMGAYAYISDMRKCSVTVPMIRSAEKLLGTKARAAGLGQMRLAEFPVSEISGVKEAALAEDIFAEDIPQHTGAKYRADGALMASAKQWAGRVGGDVQMDGAVVVKKS